MTGPNDSYCQGEERGEGTEAHHQLPLQGQHGPSSTEAGKAPPSSVLLLGILFLLSVSFTSNTLDMYLQPILELNNDNK